jgi:methanogenic corrinoid protein MtbC1
MSALLSTIIVRMADTVNAIAKAGIGDRVKIIIGGPSAKASYATEIVPTSRRVIAPFSSVPVPLSH